MLKAKLHLARVTHAELNYEGSCAIDGSVLDMAGLREYEQIQIYNKTNGNRFVTYIIRGEEGSGIISMNGAAARQVAVGDQVIICAYGSYSNEEMIEHKPSLLYMDEENRVLKISNAIAVQSL